VISCASDQLPSWPRTAPHNQTKPLCPLLHPPIKKITRTPPPAADITGWLLRNSSSVSLSIGAGLASGLPEFGNEREDTDGCRSRGFCLRRRVQCGRNPPDSCARMDPGRYSSGRAGMRCGTAILGNVPATWICAKRPFGREMQTCPWASRRTEHDFLAVGAADFGDPKFPRVAGRFALQASGRCAGGGGGLTQRARANVGGDGLQNFMVFFFSPGSVGGAHG